MKRKKFEEKLRRTKAGIHKMLMDSGVNYYTALCAYLQSADIALDFAMRHFDEYNESN